MTDREKDLWSNILDQSYEQFMAIIDENRDTLDAEQVKKLATGQVYTAKDAKANGLIDEIGFEEDSLQALADAAGPQFGPRGQIPEPCHADRCAARQRQGRSEIPSVATAAGIERAASLLLLQLAAAVAGMKP